MQKTFCDKCGKEVSIFKYPVIHGHFLFRRQLQRGAILEWLKICREEKYNEEGIWCNVECLCAWLREYLGEMPNAVLSGEKQPQKEVSHG